ncbi:MAG TPA: glycosyltransferase [Solirubrobacteraceae bacterium]|nr:glycosyltransferase [Solirubrobacteraceae bacterium]
MHSDERPALLCISQSFSPDTTPTAIRAGKLLHKLSAQWDITVVTEAQGPHRDGRLQVEVVRSWRPGRLLTALRRLRLSRLLELGVWPDESIFWVLPAVLAGRRVARARAPSAIVVFMMPYSAGLAGILLSRLTRLPLILNLDDSPTCTDMHPDFPTRLHYRLSKALEDLYVRCADAVVYVSETNLEEVRSRQREHARGRFHLVRYGADADDFHPQPARTEDFEIAYVGAMSGWWTLIEEHSPARGLKRLYSAWNRLGRHQLTVLDQRTSSPAIVGRAIIDALAEHPDWVGRVNLRIHGNPYPADVVARAVAGAGVDGVVTVLGPVAHERIAAILCSADLLFITLPARIDGSRGGRISAKTYEYLMTDRPILAAVPQGENWSYLADKPGVWLVEPNDRQGMREVIAELARAKLAGAPITFDRSHLREQLSYDARAEQFASVLNAAIEGGSHRGKRHRSPR